MYRLEGRKTEDGNVALGFTDRGRCWEPWCENQNTLDGGRDMPVEFEGMRFKSTDMWWIERAKNEESHMALLYQLPNDYFILGEGIDTPKFAWIAVEYR